MTVWHDRSVGIAEQPRLYVPLYLLLARIIFSLLKQPALAQMGQVLVSAPFDGVIRTFDDRWRTVLGRRSSIFDPCLRQYHIRLLMNHRLYIQVVPLFVKVLRFPFDRSDHYYCNCLSRKSLCNHGSLDPSRNFERNE